MIGIYKFENTINHLCYIGQSIDIERRYRAHINNIINGTTKFYKAIREYGLQNFTFTILEECLPEQLNERERYWINYYDSFFNGYNSTIGGSYGQGKNALTQEQAHQIHSLLTKNELSYQEIADKFQVSIRLIYDINVGHIYIDKKLNYPIRERVNKKTIYYCPNCGDIVSKKGNLCVLCAHQLQQKATRPSRTELKQLIRTTPFTQIGKQYNVTDNTIRKWCKSMGLPSKSTEIKNYTDEEWQFL